MSLQAVGWLSSKLGINIGGRTDSEGGKDELSPSVFDQTTSSTGQALDSYLHKLNDVIFGRDEGSLSNSAGSAAGSVWLNLNGQATAGGSAANGPRGHSAGAGEVELDENGLPVTTNWYYYDKGLNRWNVSPDAPAAIQQEFQSRLQEEEDERSGRNAIPPPPPPPPPPPSGPAPAGFFPPGTQPRQQGIFSSHATAGAPQNSTFPQRSAGPQYAVPMYFNTTGPVQAQPVPQGAQQPPYVAHQYVQQSMPLQSPYDPQQHNDYQQQQQQQQQQQHYQDKQYHHHQQQYQQYNVPGTQQEPWQSQTLSPPPTISVSGGNAYPSAFQESHTSDSQPHGAPQSSVGYQQFS